MVYDIHLKCFSRCKITKNPNFLYVAHIFLHELWLVCLVDCQFFWRLCDVTDFYDDFKIVNFCECDVMWCDVTDERGWRQPDEGRKVCKCQQKCRHLHTFLLSSGCLQPLLSVTSHHISSHHIHKSLQFWNHHNNLPHHITSMKIGKL